MGERFWKPRSKDSVYWDCCTQVGYLPWVSAELHGFSVIEPCGFNPSVMINLVDLVPSGRNINMMEVESILLDKLVAEIQSARVAEEN